MPRLAENNAKSLCLENHYPTSRLTCTGARGVNQAVIASRACSQDTSNVQYINLSWIFFNDKRVVLGTKKNMYIQKEFSTFHEKTNMAAYYFRHRDMANEM